MAFLPQSQQERDAQEEKDKQAGGSQTQEQTLSTGSGFAAGTGASGQSGAGSGQGRSGFVNLQDYLKANEGENATKMAGDVSGNIAQSVNDYKATADKAVTDISAKADGATIRSDVGLIDKAKNNLSGVITSDADRASMEAGRQKYTGPTAQQATDDYAAAVTPAKTKAKGKISATNDFAGTGALLRDTYTQPERTYTKGENSLDNFIVGASAPGKQMIENTKNLYSGLDAEDSQRARLATQAATQAAAASSKTNSDWDTILKLATDKAQGDYKAAMDAAAAANKKADDDYKALQQRLGTDFGKRDWLLENMLGDSAMGAMEADTLAMNMVRGLEGQSRFDFNDVLQKAAPQRRSADSFMDPTSGTNYTQLRQYLGGEGWDAGYNQGADANIKQYDPNGAALLAQARQAANSQPGSNNSEALANLNASLAADRQARQDAARASDVNALQAVMPGLDINRDYSEEEVAQLWKTYMGNTPRTAIKAYGAPSGSPVNDGNNNQALNNLGL